MISSVAKMKVKRQNYIVYFEGSVYKSNLFLELKSKNGKWRKTPTLIVMTFFVHSFFSGLSSCLLQREVEGAEAPKTALSYADVTATVAATTKKKKQPKKVSPSLDLQPPIAATDSLLPQHSSNEAAANDKVRCCPQGHHDQLFPPRKRRNKKSTVAATDKPDQELRRPSKKLKVWWNGLLACRPVFSEAVFFLLISNLSLQLKLS